MSVSALNITQPMLNDINGVPAATLIYGPQSYRQIPWHSYRDMRACSLQVDHLGTLDRVIAMLAGSLI